MEWNKPAAEPLEQGSGLDVAGSSEPAQQQLQEQQAVIKSIMAAVQETGGKKLHEAARQLQTAQATIAQQEARIAELEAALAAALPRLT